MAKNKFEKLPQFDSRQELVEFFNTHDMGEYEDELLEAHFDVDIKRNHYLVSVDGYLISLKKRRLRLMSTTVIILVGLLLQSNVLLAHDNHQHNTTEPVKTDAKKASEYPTEKPEQVENKSQLSPPPQPKNSSELTQNNLFLQPGELIFGLLVVSPFGLLALKRWIHRS